MVDTGRGEDRGMQLLEKLWSGRLRRLVLARGLLKGVAQP